MHDSAHSNSNSTIWYGTSARLQPPPGFSRAWLRVACRSARTRPRGAVRLPGRGGWGITAADWDAWVRTRDEAADPEPATAEQELRALGYR